MSILYQFSSFLVKSLFCALRSFIRIYACYLGHAHDFTELWQLRYLSNTKKARKLLKSVTLGRYYPSMQSMFYTCTGTRLTIYKSCRWYPFAARFICFWWHLYQTSSHISRIRVVDLFFYKCLKRRIMLWLAFASGFVKEFLRWPARIKRFSRSYLRYPVIYVLYDEGSIQNLRGQKIWFTYIKYWSCNFFKHC